MVWNTGLKRDPRCKGGRPKGLSYVGQTYGRLTILEQYSDKKNVFFKCQCECGNIKNKVRKDYIIGPKAEVKSCGCRLQELHQERREKGIDEVSAMWSRAKYRAKQKGLDFTIEQKDIIIPDKCPLLGIPLECHRGKGSQQGNSPSLDRIDPTKGYIKGNVWVISNRANTLKNDATLQELELLVENLKCSSYS
jgi:hypothetical protein